MGPVPLLHLRGLRHRNGSDASTVQHSVYVCSTNAVLLNLQMVFLQCDRYVEFHSQVSVFFDSRSLQRVFCNGLTFPKPSPDIYNFFDFCRWSA